MNLDQKKIVITGASEGIGKEMVRLLLEFRDVKIVAAARDTANIPHIENKLYPFSTDLSTKEGVDRLFCFAEDKLGCIDVFIADAGFGYLEKVDKPDWNHVEKIYALNVFSPLYVLQKLAAGEPSPNKSLVCISSGAGLVPLPYYSLYCSTKAALHTFFQTYRFEQPENIEVTVVYPVAIKTRFFDKASGRENTPIPYPRQTPEVVARRILKGVENGKKKVYTSFFFRWIYPIGRAFPFLMKISASVEKRRVKEWAGF